MNDTMTDENRCEPPPELRDRDGWHWLKYRDHPDDFAEWNAKSHEWWLPKDQVFAPVSGMAADWRYVGQYTPPATVAALVEALEAAVDCGLVPKSSAAEGGAMRFSRQVGVADQIRAALALYRDAGR